MVSALCTTRTLPGRALPACALLLAPILVTTAAAQGGQVLHVPRDYPTIQAAVHAANEGAIIHVKGGTYQENVVITTSDVRLQASAGVLLDGSAIGGVGIHVRGTAERPISGVEISGFEVANFITGIMLERAVHARVHRNESRHNRIGPRIVPPEAVGIALVATHSSQISQNFVHSNEGDGIRLAQSSSNLVRGNRVHDNGEALVPVVGVPVAVGIVVFGPGSNDNELRENEVLRNHGWGIVLFSPPGVAVITGNRVAQNRAHENLRSGIAIMNAAVGNYVLQNDARDNNLSGLPPCFGCNLVELFTPGPNVWERNLGTFNLTDACAP